MAARQKRIKRRTSNKLQLSTISTCTNKLRDVGCSFPHPNFLCWVCLHSHSSGTHNLVSVLSYHFCAQHTFAIVALSSVGCTQLLCRVEIPAIFCLWVSLVLCAMSILTRFSVSGSVAAVITRSNCVALEVQLVLVRVPPPLFFTERLLSSVLLSSSALTCVGHF